jgi:hypothetical protein
MLNKGYDGIQNDYPNLRLTHLFKAHHNHPLEEDQKANNRLVSRYRIVVEHSLAQMNRFQVLSQVYRHSRKGHGRLVRIVAGLVNRSIDMQPIKTYASRG